MRSGLKIKRGWFKPRRPSFNTEIGGYTQRNVGDRARFTSRSGGFTLKVAVLHQERQLNTQKGWFYTMKGRLYTQKVAIGGGFTTRIIGLI